MENKDKKKSNIIKELNKTPRGRAILFFVGYFFFFLFLMVFVRTAGEGTGNSNYDETKKYSFSVNNITKNNYHFNHSVMIDESFVNYVGQRYDEKDLFIMSDILGEQNYYRDGLEYFSNSNGIWVMTNNPYTYEDFFNIKNIMRLIDQSMLMYKTDYESGKRVYNFNVSTTTIHNLLEGIDLDLADDVNEIMVTVDDSDNVYEIEFKLDSYCKSLGICTNKMNITLTYEKFGEIEEITNPLG